MWSPDPIVFDGVAVPDGERVVVPAGLGVADEEGPVLVLLQQQLLLGLYPLDLPKIPPATRDIFQNSECNGSIIRNQV